MSDSLDVLRVALLSLAVAACGGDGGGGSPAFDDPNAGGPDAEGPGADGSDAGDPASGDGGSGGNVTGGGTDADAGGDAPGPVGAEGSRFSYRTLPAAVSVADFEAAANAQGAEGYRYLGPATFDDVPPFALFDLYARDESDLGAYAIRLRPYVDSAGELLEQTNAQGSEGFAWRGAVAFTGTSEVVSLYVRDETRPGTYVHEALEVVQGEAFVEQLNAQGARGFRYLSPLAFEAGLEVRAFYVLDASAPGRFVHRTRERAASLDALIAQMNEEGGSGHVYRGEVFADAFVPGEPTPTLLSLYARDETRSGTYAYTAERPAESAEEFVADALVQGRASRLYVGDILGDVADPSSARSLYLDVSDCDCRPLPFADPFTN